MVKHSFKIGDKVKLKGSFCGITGNGTGKVVGIEPRSFCTYIIVSWSGDLEEGLGERYPHKISEIEYVIKVGEQLMFNFIKEIRNG